MKVALTGATGFIGRPLVAHLAALGHRCHVMSRDPQRASACGFPPGTQFSSMQALPQCDAVIHLAGESVAGWWSPWKRRAILRSRIESTRGLVAQLGAKEKLPHTLLVASAIGYYGDRPGELLDETAPPDPADGFRSRVCRAWEAAAVEAERLGMRVVRLRLGNVMHPSGGLFGAMLPLWRRGACFVLGRPEAPLSWIAREDAVRLVAFALETAELRGPVNIVAPHPITQRTLVTSISARLGRTVIGQLPAWFLRATLGELATTLLDEQHVIPAAAEAAGFRFQYPAWRSSLDELFPSEVRG